jgi:Asp-tRNA(Asn)/Glu-tRNA(Gln) amidotransferase C subunit
MREDVATKFDAESILALAPEREENFIVVPMILDQE